MQKLNVFVVSCGLKILLETHCLGFFCFVFWTWPQIGTNKQ